MDLITTFRTAIVEDALTSLKKTETARMEWLTLQDSLSGQLTSRNVAEAEAAARIVDREKEIYNKLRDDLATKVIILNEKR